MFRWLTRKHRRHLAEEFAKLHRHIDFAQRDLLVAVRRAVGLAVPHDVRLETDRPVAVDSLDHLQPLGTGKDNTRHPRFIRHCERLFPGRDALSFLDLGCSGGGLVLDALLRGHFALGLEGSDLSLRQQRAEWRLIPENLMTCDVCAPFRLRGGDGTTRRFDVVTAWELLEHLPEDRLPVFFANLREHLADGGYFMASVAFASPREKDPRHITSRPREWWEARLAEHGLRVREPLETWDMPRGAQNPPLAWESPRRTPAENASLVASKA